MSTSRMVDTTAECSSDPPCSSCAKLKEALEASKKEHSLTLRMVKEKIISTDELIKKYQQKCHESDKHQQQSTDSALKLEAAQMKIESLQSQLDRTLHSSEPLRKNVARLHREKSLADSTISELREKLQNIEKTNSELLSTAKIKEEQECAWRLEKQVQAHEMQKQKKSLQKSEAAIAKLQEEVKKGKEKNKELNKLLGQANRKAAKMEQQLQKTKEEIQSIKLEAEFAKALGEDSTKKTSKPRQRQKARQPPRQPPSERKQASPSASHPNQHLAHIIEELALLSDMEPALSPLPPSPDREALEGSSSSEEESGSGSSSEDDGRGNEDEDSDYSLGDLADMLIGDHGEGENLAASPKKTRSSDQDIHEDVENSFGEETKTKNDADCAKSENESSVRQSPKEASASDVEVSENFSLANYNVANPQGETLKCLTMTQEGSIEAEMNENSHIAESDSSDRKKTDDESAKTKEPSNAEKCTVVTPSPQRKAKRRMASPKPRVMTRSRAKAMKLSSSSDAESSSERETGMEVNSTQENSSEVSETGLKRNSNASDIGKSNGGGSCNNENVSSVALVDNMKEFTESSQATESQVHGEGNFQSFLSGTLSSDADDAVHHHGNDCELVCSVASLSDLKDQVRNEDNSNVLLVGVEEDTIHQQSDGEPSCSGALLSGSEEQVGNEGNSNVLLVGMDTDTIHQQSDGEPSCSGAFLTDSDKQVGNEDNSNVLSVGMDTDAIHNQRNDGELSCWGTLVSDSEKQGDNEDNSNVLSVSVEADAIHHQRNDGELSCSLSSFSDLKEQVDSEANSNVLSVGMDTDTIHNQRDDGELSCSGALLTDSEKQVGNEDNLNVFTGGQEADGSRLGHSTALLSEQVANEDNSDVSSAPVSKATANIPTELGIEIEQEFSSNSESGSGIKGDALLNMTREEIPDINEFPSIELDNENADSILANKIISEINTEESQTSQDSKITTDVNGNTLLLQLETKENAFEGREDTLEENNNNVSEDFEATPEQLEVGAALVVDADSSDQTQPFVCKTQNHSTCTTERKSWDVSDLSTTCDDSKSEDRSIEKVYFSSDEESDADSSLSVVVSGKATASTSVETSKGETADVSSSTVEIDFNLSILTCEKETTTTAVTTSTTETTECPSTKEHVDETFVDSKLTLEEGDHSHTSDEAMQSCSIEEQEVQGSKRQDFSIQENISVLTNEPSRKNSKLEKDVSSSGIAIKEGEEISTCNEERKNYDCVKDVPPSNTVTKEAREPSTSNEGRKESDLGRDVSSRAIGKESSLTSYDERRHFDVRKDVSSTAMSKESSSTVNEGRKHSDMGRDVSSTAMRKESCSTFNEGKKNSNLGRDVSSRAEAQESPLTSIERKRDSALERNVSSSAVSKESYSTFNAGRRNSDLGRHVSPRIISKEGSSSSNEERNYSECEKEVFSHVDVREPSTFNKGRKRFAIKRDVSSTRTVAEKAGERKSPSSSLLDAEESKLEERGTSLELPSSPTKADPPDDSPAVCDLVDDSPIQASFNNLEGLLDDFPALSPLPPSPSDDDECSTSPISSSNLNEEKSNRVTELTSAEKTFDVQGKPEFKRDRTLNYTEVASRSVKRTSLGNGAAMYITESNKLDISVKPRNCLAKDKTSKSASTPCSGGSASMKRPLQWSVSVPPRAGENASLKRSYQQSVSEPVNNKNAVSQKSKKMKTHPKIPHKQETPSLEKRLDIPRVPVKKATFSQPSKKNGATKGPILVNSKGPLLAGNKEPILAGNKKPILAGNKGPLLAGNKEPILAGNKEPILAGNKEPILVGNNGPILAGNKGPILTGNKEPILTGNKEPVLVDDDGPIVEFNEGLVLEEESKNTNNSAKATGDKHSKYRPLSVRPGYMPEVKYVFKCLSRVLDDNVELRVVVERLTTKRCISSSTPVASAIVQFLKEREDDVIPQILDQLEHFQTDESLNNWQPVVSSFESRLLEVVSLLSSDTLFGNLIPRLVSLCSRSLIEARCSSNNEEVLKGDLSLCRVFTALCQLKEDLGSARTLCYDIIRSLYGSQNSALELVVTMVTVWPEVLKTFSDCSRGKQSPVAHTLKLVLLHWAQNSPSANLGNILRVLCCWGDDSVMEEELKHFGLQLIQPLHEERVTNVSIGKDESMVFDRHSFEVVKSLELLSCVLGWQWTLNELIVNNVWQILKSWADNETKDEPTTDRSEPETASSGKQNKMSTCCCHDLSVSSEVSTVAVLSDDGTSDESGFTTAGEKKEERNRMGGEDEVLEICSKCGKLMGSRLPESQTVRCIQLLGVLCRIAIENGQTPVREITNMLCGLIEEGSSPTSKNKVTYAIQLAATVSLLDMSPWQPERVAAVLGKWITVLKESGSLQAPAYVAQGLVCLKSVLRINQT